MQHFDGDGDFRSPESIALLKQADIVVTNPPFSLFREYIAQLIEHDKKFLIIGNMNAVTYKEVWPHIQANRIWLGVTRAGTGQMWFRVGEGFPVKSGQKIGDDGYRYQTIGNSAWFTNLDHTKRHEEMILFKTYDSDDYPSYDNYEGIEVSKAVNIPMDWEGVMGVPITFLGKHNPEQFDILGITDRGDEFGLKTREYSKNETPNASDLNRRAAIKLSDETLKSTYARILIRRKGAPS